MGKFNTRDFVGGVCILKYPFSRLSIITFFTIVRTVLLLLYFSLSSVVIIWGQNSIGLRAASVLRGTPFGAYVNFDNIENNVDNGQYITNIKENYQIIGLENELKYQHIWVAENVYDFAAADLFLGSTPNTTGWAQQNSMQFRGHNVIWSPDMWTPAWLLNEELSITPEKANQLLSDYIHTLVGHYRGKYLVGMSLTKRSTTSIQQIHSTYVIVFGYESMAPLI